MLVSWALIQGHAGCWQNPVFVAVRTGLPVSLLAVPWEPLSASADFSPGPPVAPRLRALSMQPSVPWNLRLPLLP